MGYENVRTGKFPTTTHLAQQARDRLCLTVSHWFPVLQEMPEVNVMNIAPKTLVANEKPEDFELIEKLAEEAFGPGRFTRTAFRLREGILHEPELSFVTWKDHNAVASVRLTKFRIGDRVALLLGPLVVTKELKSKGYGAELMNTAVNAAREAGYGCIVLVGDLPYYQRFGFQVVAPGMITMPGPVDPQRLLICPLQEGAEENYQGVARPFA